MTLSARSTMILLAAWVVASTACTSDSTPVTTTTGPPTTPTEATSAPTSTTSTTRTTPATTSTSDPPTTTTTEPPPAKVAHAVVAEERARHLSVIDLAPACIGEPGCAPQPLMRIELSERPHNLAAIGSVVYATHPAAGSMSRVDVATGDVLTTAVGTEPHDVKVDAGTMTLVVTDEAGQALLRIDPRDLAVLEEVELPAEAHDVSLREDVAWVTLNGRSELARISGGPMELHETGRTPHDVLAAPDGRIWFSSWGSEVLSIYDPTTGETLDAPAGVEEPHHFAIGPADSIWVTDNGGSSIVAFDAGGTAQVEVGPTPHHLAFVGDIVTVAVSGSGEAVLVRDGAVVARVALSSGLHGVAIIELDEPSTR